MHMNRPLLILPLILLLALSGCSDAPANDPQPQTGPQPAPELTERVAMLMGGWPHAKAITETGKATAFRIGVDEDFKEIMLSDGIELTADQRESLVSLLAQDDSYEWEIAKGCEPMPGVLITFEDGATYARTRICFSCRMIGFTPGNWEDFDPINDELVQWVKGVFPDDELIQKLGTEEEAGGL